MLKQEWKQLFSRPLLLGTMIVMMFIPIIYGGFFLGSSWDPYGKTDRLPVAVVNQDKAAVYEGTIFDVGEELVENLKANDSLEWHFTDAENAAQGMADGEYFMVLTIPSDFSANAASVMDDQPTAMNLRYETNPGRGFFIEAVSKQATSEIKEEIAENVTKEYVKAVFAQVETLGEDIETAADGANRLNDGTVRLKDGNAELMAGLDNLSSGTLMFQEGATEFKVGVKQFAGGAMELNDGAGKLGKGVFAYTEGVSKLQSGISSLVQGTAELNDNGPSLVKGSGDLAEGLGSLISGAEELHEGLSETQRGSSQLDSGLHELQIQMEKLTTESSEIQQLVAGQIELGEGLRQLATGSASLQAGLHDLNNGLPASELIGSIQQGLADIQESISQLNSSMAATEGQNASTIQADLAAAQQSISDLKATPSPSAVAALQTSPVYGSLTTEQQAALTAAVSQSEEAQSLVQQQAIAALDNSLNSVSADLNEEIFPAFQSLGTLPEQIERINSTIAQVNPAAGQALSGYSAVHEVLSDQLVPGADALHAGTEEAVQGNEKLLTGTQKAAEKLPELSDAVDRLAEGGSSLANGISALASGSNGLVEGTSVLQKGSQALEEGTIEYTNGVSEAAAGVGKLQKGTDELTANSAPLNAGADSLAGGAKRLAVGAPSLTDGADELVTGASELHGGAWQLTDGSGELAAGIGKLEEGTSRLASSLADGSEQLKETQLADANFEMIAAPVTTTESRQSEVPNYGHALAPYILSLGLFVGALSFNLVFPIGLPAGRPTSGTAWWLSKFSLGFVQATLAALIVDAIMLLGFHLQVEHIGEFIAISVAASLTYMFLIMFLGITFGNPGRFMAMILLVLQLGASGGMFPVELTNSFYQTVHDYVPMSYALLGFREAMSSAYGIDTFIMSICVLGAFVLFFNFLLWLVLGLRSRKAFRLAEEN